MSNDIYALKMKFDYMIPVCFTNYRQQQKKKSFSRTLRFPQIRDCFFCPDFTCRCTE